MLGFKPREDKPERTKRSFEAFRKKHLDIEKEISSPAYSALCRFLKSWSPALAENYTILNEVTTGFGVFQIMGETTYAHQDPMIEKWWRTEWRKQHEENKDEPAGQCLVTGHRGKIARLHLPMIKSVGGQAQAALVGFNDSAYESYGKSQGLNAPVSELAAFEYGTALNALLDGPMRSKHRLKIGDADVVFWTNRPSIVEDIFAQFMIHSDEPRAPNTVQDEALRQKLEAFLRALRTGIEKYGDVDREPERDRFSILALSPNRGRISVRFFYQGSIRELLDNLRRHYHDSAIGRLYGKGAKRPDPEFPPIWMLIRQTAREGDDIPPLLSGPLLRAILTGGQYPDALYEAVIRRIRAERTINYCRAFVIKGWQVRNQKKEVNMTLDCEQMNPAYRIGRLFAALEKTQADALGDIGSTIRDRFYSAASATPQVVFPRLLRTYQHHLAKLEGGRKVTREKLVQEIVEPMSGFPAHLNLADQGMFALGYYHQMQAFFRRKGENASEKSEE